MNLTLFLLDAMIQGGDIAARAFAAMMTMRKIEVAKIEAAVNGEDGDV